MGTPGEAQSAWVGERAGSVHGCTRTAAIVERRARPETRLSGLSQSIVPGKCGLLGWAR
jgi:hypothetical protein